MAQNRQVGQRTKHIDVRDHYIRELIEKGLLKRVFTWIKNNYVDILTKNVNQELHKKHANQINQGRSIYDATPEKVMSVSNTDNQELEEEIFISIVLEVGMMEQNIFKRK